MRIFLLMMLLVLVAGTDTFGRSASFDGPPTATFAAAENESGEFYDPFAEPEGKRIEDPLESLNRALFHFNDLIYTRVLAPLCRSVSPEVKETLAAAVATLKKPLRIGHTELKLAFRDGGSEAGRFILHTALDLLHHRDPAITRSLHNGEEDFGTMLQALGAEAGIYLVLPVLGPSSLRDGIGRITAFYLDPSPQLCSLEVRREIAGEDSSFTSALRAYEEIRRQTLDPYLFVRDAYAQQLASAERDPQVTRAASHAEPPGRAKTGQGTVLL